jgi:hypothetical protein
MLVPSPGRFPLRRSTLLVALTLVPAVTIAAHAAPAKVCNLVVDAKGDSAASVIPGDAAVDLIGGDFASNAKQVTAVIKVDKIVNPNPQSPLGQSYFMVFGLKGTADLLTLSAGLYPTGNEFKFGYQGVDPNTNVSTSYTLGDATGVVDTAKNEFRITADIAKFPQAKLLAPKGSVTTMTAEARRVYGQRVVPSQQVGPARVPFGGATLTFDTAEGKKYTLGAPSCVNVGK